MNDKKESANARQKGLKGKKFKFKSEFELRMGSGLFPVFFFSILALTLSLSLPRSGLPDLCALVR